MWGCHGAGGCEYEKIVREKKGEICRLQALSEGTTRIGEALIVLYERVSRQPKLSPDAQTNHLEAFAFSAQVALLSRPSLPLLAVLRPKIRQLERSGPSLLIHRSSYVVPCGTGRPYLQALVSVSSFLNRSFLAEM